MGKAALLRRWGADSRGATAIELALAMPVLVLLLVGGVCSAQVVFAAGSLRFAAQEAARCASVQTAVCTDSATISAFGAEHYQGPAISPTFSHSTAGCGHTITATGSYAFTFPAITVPLSASACFP